MLDALKTCRRKRVTAKQLFNHLVFRAGRGKRIYLGYQPITLTFAVTDRCTFRCHMCHVHSPVIRPEPHFNIKKKDLSYDLFRRVLATFPQCRNVTFVGTGEPLLHEDFFAMVALADRRHMVTSTITNGLLLERQKEGILASSLDEISVSLNGYCRDDFARITGMDREHFDTIVRNIHALTTERNQRGHHLRVAASFILDRENYRQAQDMLGLARDVGADVCSLHNFIPSATEGYTAQERSLFWSAETERFFRRLPIPSGMAVTLPRLLRHDRRYSGCRFFFTTLRIDSDGYTGSCGGSLLNLNGHPKYSESDVWNSDYLMSMRKRFLSKSQDLPGPCYVCPHNY